MWYLGLLEQDVSFPSVFKFGEDLVEAVITNVHPLQFPIGIDLDVDVDFDVNDSAFHFVLVLLWKISFARGCNGVSEKMPGSKDASADQLVLDAEIKSSSKQT